MLAFLKVGSLASSQVYKNFILQRLIKTLFFERRMMMAKDGNKKPFYKKWWFWLLVIILIIALTNCGNEEDDTSNVTNETEETQNDTNDETEKEEDQADEEPAAEEDQKEESKAATRDNSSAAQTVLNTGKFTVGTDIPVGRYVITGDGSGNFFVYDENGMPVVNEILDPAGEFGVKSLTTDIEEGQKIEISGINNVTFTPAETKLLTSLTAGNWEVGLDIAAGRYDVTTAAGSGNFFVYNSLGLPEVNEILDASGEFGVNKLTVDLEDGQTISISGLNSVDFTSK